MSDAKTFGGGGNRAVNANRETSACENYSFAASIVMVSMAYSVFLLVCSLLAAHLHPVHSLFVRATDCFDGSSYDGSPLRFNLGFAAATITIGDGFPLHMALYGVFNNASTKFANSTASHKVYAMARVEISTLGFQLLQFNLTQDDFAPQLYTAPDTALCVCERLLAGMETG